MRTSTLAALALLLSGCSDSPKPNTKDESKPESIQGSVTQDPKTPAPVLPSKANPDEGPIIEHTVSAIDGSKVKLGDYRGKALLIVNTASECGYTPQYAGLQELHENYAERGLVIMAFPSNDFGGQEPGTPEEIAAFVKKDYGVQFPMFGKVKTKGEGQSPLYKTLTSEITKSLQGEVDWNFTKFLVNPEGYVVGRFDSKVDPMDKQVTAALESVLPERPAAPTAQK